MQVGDDGAIERVEEILSASRFGDIGGYERLSRVDGCAEVVVEGLVRSCEAEDWGRFEMFVLGSKACPSSAAVAVLCEVLGRQVWGVNNEDIIEVLGLIGDPMAIDALAASAQWQPDWDEFNWIAIKSVLALAEIGTEDALVALREIASTASERVRERAVAKLRYLGG